MWKKAVQVLRAVLLVLGLTILTQVGGIIYLFTRLTVWCWPRYRRWHFPLAYILVWLLLPLLAKPLGRVPLPIRATSEVPLRCQNGLMVLANRHYVRPELRKAAIEVAQDFVKTYPLTPVTYLDANFPFWDGFPLLPHLSHNDGRKLDLAFVYHTLDAPEKSAQHTRVPAFLGYGRCDKPNTGEQDQAAICAAQGYWQYSFTRTLAQPIVALSRNYEVDAAATAHLLRLWVKHPSSGKLLLEPHLKQRWNLGYNKVRFQGCHAVRHDDHVHVQL